MYEHELDILEKWHHLSDVLKYLSDFTWFSNEKITRNPVMSMKLDPIHATSNMLQNHVPLILCGCWDVHVQK